MTTCVTSIVFFGRLFESASTCNNPELRRLVHVLNDLITGIRRSNSGGNSIELRLITDLELFQTERERPEDYQTKIVFSVSPPITKRVYKLVDGAVYVSEGYTTVYWQRLNAHAIFDSANDVAWNVIRPLLPNPYRVYSPTVRSLGTSSRDCRQRIRVNTALTHPLFDIRDDEYVVSSSGAAVTATTRRRRR